MNTLTRQPGHGRARPFSIGLPGVLVAIAMTATPVQVCGQQLPVEPADRIHGGWDMVVVLDDPRVVSDGIRQFYADNGQGQYASFFVSSLFPESRPGIANEAGAILYLDESDPLNGVLQVELDDVAEAKRNFLEDHDEQPWIDLEYSSRAWGGPVSWPMSRKLARIDGDRLYFGDRDLPEVLDTLTTAPMLAERLDQPLRRIINESGASLIVTGKTLAEQQVIDIQSSLDQSAVWLNREEQEWLQEFTRIKPVLGALGLKYTDRSLRLRGRFLIEDQVSFDQLFDLQESGGDWQPDLGLVSEGLLIALAARLDVFYSSAGARVLPQAVFREISDHDGLRFLQGNLLEAMLQLTGESWNELSAGRIALYRNPADANAGQLAIIGVVDARDPHSVIDQLRRLSSLTRPTGDATVQQQRETEIRSLIEQLQSTDSKRAVRAEIRLRWAGEDALPFLRPLAASGAAPAGERARRVIRRIQAGDKVVSRLVSDPWLWATLNPELELLPEPGSLLGHPVWTVRVTADPGRPEQEIAKVRAGMEYMFGPHWDRIQLVQLDSRFVIMMGSRQALLEQIAGNVLAGSRYLTDSFSTIADFEKNAQLQVCFHARRLGDFLGLFQGWTLPDSAADQVSWIGVQFESSALDIEGRIPADQVFPFLGFSGF